MPESTIRDWLALGATALSALFAGLIWWMARKRLNSRYEFKHESNMTPDIQGFSFIIANRTDATITIEAMSVKKPISILVDDTGGAYGTAVNHNALPTAKRVKSINVIREIPPEGKQAWTVVLHREGGFNSCSTVSIALHILKSFPIIRHKKKVLRAILPASTRNSSG